MRLNPNIATVAAIAEEAREAAASPAPQTATGGEADSAADENSIYDAAPKNTGLPQEVVTDDAVPIIVSVCPDVCWTPRGSEMIPIPYNIYARADKGKGLTSTVKYRGERIYTLRSFTKDSRGAEPGTGGGVVSKTVGEKCEPIEGSRTVRAEGSPIIRDGDMFYMNNRNTIGKVRIVRNTKIYKTPAAYSDEYARGVPEDEIKIHWADGGEDEDA